MEYFYIASSLASLIAFFGYVFDRFIENEKKGVTYSLIGVFVFLTFIFWLWFYINPNNIVRNTIENRTYAISTFSNNELANELSIVEGKFEARQWEGTVFLPPFQEPPIIVLKRPNGYEKYRSDSSPKVVPTTDSFTYKISSSSELGTWVYRARGKLLKPRSN